MAKISFHQLILISSLVCSALSVDVTFFKNASSACATGCSFTDVSIWNPRVPQNGDTVFIVPDNEITLTVSQDVNLAGIKMNSTTLLVQPILFTVSSATAELCDLRFSGASVWIDLINTNDTSLEFSACAATIGSNNVGDSKIYGSISLKNGNAITFINTYIYAQISDDGISGNITLDNADFVSSSQINQNIIAKDADNFLQSWTTTGSVTVEGTVTMYENFTAGSIHINGSLFYHAGTLIANSIEVLPDGRLSVGVPFYLSSIIIADVTVASSAEFDIWAPVVIEGTLDIAGSYSVVISEKDSKLKNVTMVDVTQKTTLYEGSLLDISILEDENSDEKNTYSILKANPINGTFTKPSWSVHGDATMKSKSVVQENNEVSITYSYGEDKNGDKKFPVLGIVLLVVVPAVAVVLAAFWFFKKKSGYATLK